MKLKNLWETAFDDEYCVIKRRLTSSFVVVFLKHSLDNSDKHDELLLLRVVRVVVVVAVVVVYRVAMAVFHTWEHFRFTTLF